MIRKPQKWTRELVEERFEEAASTLKRLPSVRVQGYICSWPPILRDAWELMGMAKPQLRLGPPTPDKIDEMNETIGWVFLLEEKEAKLVWLRAENVPWKLIQRRFGISRPTAWRWYNKALDKIVKEQNSLQTKGLR